MSHTYVGLTPRFLASGRPIVFGDVLEDADLMLTDEVTRANLVPSLDAPAPAPAQPDSQPEPREAVTTGNETQASDNPEPEA